MLYNSKSAMSNLIIIVWLSFLRLILTFLHFAYSGYQYFSLTWNLSKRKLAKFFKLQPPDTQLFVSQFVEKLEKCPSHLAIIVGINGISVEDFSNLVSWCLAAKISFLSFYDYTGNLKANKHIYYNHLISLKNINSKSVIFDVDKPNTKNGIVQKIHLNVLSLEDGKEQLVKLAKNLSKKVSLNELKTVDINEDLISRELFQIFGFSEADLGVVCGPIFGTYGFLPWHLRVTEFVHIKSIKGIQVSEFTSILKKYSSFSQRFGK